MFKLFHKKLNKKGFTLAELLIVVAIIAILIAIAIPIFTSSLERAEQAVKNANIRAVRGAAVVEIFDKWDDTTHHFGYTDTTLTTPAKAWDVQATVSASGDITAMNIQAYDDKSGITYTNPTVTKKTDAGVVTYEVKVALTDLETVGTSLTT